MAGNSGVLDGNLVGIDGYLRLVRITENYEAGTWFEPGLARAGAPDGIVLHWTRLLDGLIIALALLMKPFLGFKAALYWSGALISPLLHIFTAVALAWAAMPLLRRADAFVAGALTAAQVGIMNYAVLGHADHHLLFTLTNVLALGFMLRALTKEGYRPFYGVATGAALATGIWVGPEALFFMALCLAAMGGAWIAGKNDLIERNLHIAIGLTLGLALVLLAERGPAAYAQVDYDQVSVVHLTLAALVLAFWGMMHGTAGTWRRTGAALRLPAAAGGAAATIAVLWLLFPKILQGPMANVDPAFVSLVGDISEFAPINSVSHFLVFAGGAVFAAPWVLWRVRQEWADGRIWPWLFLASGLLMYLALTLVWIRTSVYLGIFISVVLADLFGRVDIVISSHWKTSLGTLLKVCAILFIVIGPVATGAAGISAGKAQSQPGGVAPPDCSLRPLVQFLNKPPWDSPPLNILAAANFGPEILYRTRHSVVATLHHRNAAGVLDGIRILGGVDEAESLRLIRQRRIDFILLCPRSRHDGYMAGVDNHALYRRLVKGDTPAWLRRVTLPTDLGRTFKLFQVIGTS